MSKIGVVELQNAKNHSLCPLQPTDDIVLMALALEKIYLQKVAQMPQNEVEIVPHAAKGKGKKSSTPGNSLKRTCNTDYLLVVN